MSEDRLKNYRLRGGKVEERIGGEWKQVVFGFDWQKFAILIGKWIERNGIEGLQSNPLFFALPAVFDKFRGRLYDNLINSCFAAMGVEGWPEDDEGVMRLLLAIYVWLSANFDGFPIAEFTDDNFAEWKQQSIPRGMNAVLKPVKLCSMLREKGLDFIEKLEEEEEEEVMEIDHDDAMNDDAIDEEMLEPPQQQQQHQHINVHSSIAMPPIITSEDFKVQLSSLVLASLHAGIDRFIIAQELSSNIRTAIAFEQVPFREPFPLNNKVETPLLDHFDFEMSRDEEKEEEVQVCIRLRPRNKTTAVVESENKDEFADDSGDEWGEKEKKEISDSESDEEEEKKNEELPPTTSTLKKRVANKKNASKLIAVAGLAPAPPNQVNHIFLAFNGMPVSKSVFVDGNYLACGNELMIVQALMLRHDGGFEVSAISVIPNMTSSDNDDLGKNMRYRLVHTLIDERARLEAINYRVSNFLVVDGQFTKVTQNGTNIILSQQQHQGTQAVVQLPPQTRLLCSIAHKIENLLTQFGSNIGFEVVINGGVIRSRRVKENFDDALIPAFDLSKETLKGVLSSFYRKCKKRGHDVIACLRLSNECIQFVIARQLVIQERAHGNGFVRAVPAAQYDELVCFLDFLIELCRLWELLNEPLTQQHYLDLVNFNVYLRGLNFVGVVQYGLELADIIDNILAIYDETRPAAGMPGVPFVPLDLSMKLPYMLTASFQGERGCLKNQPFNFIFESYLEGTRLCAHGFGSGIVNFVDTPQNAQFPANEHGTAIPDCQLKKISNYT